VSAAAWTFLRAGFFAQNLGDAYRADIREHDELFVPAGDGRAAFVDVRDLGEVAARAFSEDGHAGQAYTVDRTGGAVVRAGGRLLSVALGRKIQLHAAWGAALYAAGCVSGGCPSPSAWFKRCCTSACASARARGSIRPSRNCWGGPRERSPTYIHDHLDLWR
jgi:uncharacterized protein YbjT (DUF2867 family)